MIPKANRFVFLFILVPPRFDGMFQNFLEMKLHHRNFANKRMYALICCLSWPSSICSHRQMIILRQHGAKALICI